MYHLDERLYPKKDNPLRPPEGTGTISHLRTEAEANGISRVVLVQTGSAYGWDNRLLADTARENADWTVGVCTLDPSAEDSVGELTRLVREYNVRGLRMEPTKVGQPVFDQPGAHRLWAAARDLNVVICAHVQSQFLPQLAVLLGAFPDVPVVLDHAAYPKASGGPDSETVCAVVDLARFAQLHVQLTFAVTGSDMEYPFEDMHSVVYRMIEAFGPERCMWGSDFPCELWLKKASYAQHLSLYEEALGLEEGTKEAIMGGTALRLWFGGQ